MPVLLGVVTKVWTFYTYTYYQKNCLTNQPNQRETINQRGFATISVWLNENTSTAVFIFSLTDMVILFFFQFNQVIYSSSHISPPSFKAPALEEISCWKHFILILRLLFTIEPYYTNIKISLLRCCVWLSLSNVIKRCVRRNPGNPGYL